MTDSEAKPFITISIPVLNEAENLERLYERLVQTAAMMRDHCDLEFLFTDNHSQDGTWPRLKALAEQDPRVRGIRFARNYGFQRSILINYLNARGDAVMQLDADLQDPPELLQRFFELWQQGYQVVYGIRRSRPEPFLMRQFRRAGYWVINKLSDHPIPRDTGDFRLIDQKVIQALGRQRMPELYLRGAIAGLGLKSRGVEYDRDVRRGGESKFSPTALLMFGMVALLNHSAIPLRVATYTGLTALAVSVLGALYYIGLKILSPDLPEGLASIHILVLFAIGLNSLFLGIIGEYVRQIFFMLRSGQKFLLEDTANIEEAAELSGDLL